jgi:hypothetical protein
MAASVQEPKPKSKSKTKATPETKPPDVQQEDPALQGEAAPAGSQERTAPESFVSRSRQMAKSILTGESFPDGQTVMQFAQISIGQVMSDPEGNINREISRSMKARGAFAKRFKMSPEQKVIGDRLTMNARAGRIQFPAAANEVTGFAGLNIGSKGDSVDPMASIGTIGGDAIAADTQRKIEAGIVEYSQQLQEFSGVFKKAMKIKKLTDMDTVPFTLLKAPDTQKAIEARLTGNPTNWAAGYGATAAIGTPSSGNTTGTGLIPSALGALAKKAHNYSTQGDPQGGIQKAIAEYFGQPCRKQTDCRRNMALWIHDHKRFAHSHPR